LADIARRGHQHPQEPPQPSRWEDKSTVLSATQRTTSARKRSIQEGGTPFRGACEMLKSPAGRPPPGHILLIKFLDLGSYQVGCQVVMQKKGKNLRMEHCYPGGVLCGPGVLGSVEGNPSGYRRRRGRERGEPMAHGEHRRHGAGHGGCWPRETNLSLRASDNRGNITPRAWGQLKPKKDRENGGAGLQRANILWIWKVFGSVISPER
jgi:hypothetical protein